MPRQWWKPPSLVIARVLDHIEQQDWATLATSLETHEFLDRLRHELPQVEAVFLVDPNGIIAASSRAYPMPRYDVHSAEYFAAPKAQNSDGIVISAPIAGTVSGTNGVHDQPPANAGTAQFDGVVGVTVSRAVFRDLLSRDPGPSRTASAAGLIRTDGALLVRFPDPPDHPVMLPAVQLRWSRRAESGQRIWRLRRPLDAGRQ